MDPFVNEPLTTAELPSLDDQAFTSIEPAYLHVSLVGGALLTATVIVLCTVLVVTTAAATSVVVAVGFGALVAITLLTALRAGAVRRMAYLIRSHDISYRRGLLVSTISTIPFVRVQHARIRQGPVERLVGLATLEINSAGPDLRMPGLAAETAEQIKLLVVDRAGDLTENE